MFKVLKLCNFISIQPHVRAIKATGIEPKKVIFNPNVPHLYQDTFLNEKPADPYTKMSFVSSNGALCAYSGKNTERKLKNSRLVKDNITEKTVDWNQNNIAIDESTYDLIQKLSVDYINHRPKLFLVDGYLGWDKNYRLKVRSYVTRTYHALFLRNILVRPTPQQIQKDFSTGVDITLFNSGQLTVSKNMAGTQDQMISAINLSQQKIAILGTQFAGQMKKSLLKLSSYILPRKGQLPLRASAFTTQDNNVCLLIGLPGSGKGSLALHARKQNLIANDQVLWSSSGISNLQGGVYARILNLRNRLEDQVYKTIRFGALVQNANHLKSSRQINFHDVSVTENARICYPIQHLKSFKNPPTSTHPKNVILLTCDLQGVLPPVAKLTREQAIFFFLNGYTAKLNNKQIQPKSAFQECLSGQTLPLQPSVYVDLFSERLEKNNPNIWLLNTGWTNGRYGVGKRISTEDSVKIIDAINSGQLDNAQTYNFSNFNFSVPKSIQGINEKILHPEESWANKEEYKQTSKNLARKFVQNYKSKFHGRININLDSAIPKI